LRLPHIEEAVAIQPSVGWLEIHPENFLANAHATELLVAFLNSVPGPISISSCSAASLCLGETTSPLSRRRLVSSNLLCATREL